jgi:hypothetical protein
LSRRNKRRTSPPSTPGAGSPDQPDADVLNMIARILAGELDGPDLVVLHAATRRRIEDLLAARPPHSDSQLPRI